MRAGPEPGAARKVVLEREAPSLPSIYANGLALVLITTTRGPERFSIKFEQIQQIHARNFLKEAVEHAILANLKPCVKHLPNTYLVKNP
jgi:hypothetical protein